MLQYLRIIVEAHRARMDERGASAVEYGLLVFAVAAAVVAAMVIFGPAITGLFTDTSNSIDRTP
ncbi:Flp family type IVb pilin [Nocardioides aquiterrae]|uniref:Flp family type IVb pilin n=1 Tax=Nocardioides aquiterrae TaxID=203799 RepID=A0ABP4F805_9ACTN